ncbi:hypothetical protein SNEBB_004936 [Seison nebaliae]|nr:hypothetical protein SNEBB_004936 [Seison nebaliae]
MKVSYDKIGNDIQLIITFHIVLNVLDEMKKNGLFIPFGNLLGNKKIDGKKCKKFYETTIKLMNFNNIINDNHTIPNELHLMDMKNIPQISQLSIHQHLQDVNGNYGTLILTVRKSGTHSEFYVEQSLPWFIHIQYYSIQVTNGHVIEQFIIPSIDRQRNSYMKLKITSTNEIITISLNYQLLLLIWSEYTPDANAGTKIPSAILTIDDGRQFFSSLTEVHLPVPDFSMPYNVICFTCTAIAIVFGSLHYITTKQPRLGKSEGLLVKLFHKLKK